jgi:hypothetical protein
LREEGKNRRRRCFDRAKNGRNGVAPLQRLGTEEDGFTLEHLDGDEKSRCSVDTGGCEDKRDVIPVIGAGDKFLAKQAGIKDRN